MTIHIWRGNWSANVGCVDGGNPSFSVLITAVMHQKITYKPLIIKYFAPLPNPALVKGKANPAQVNELLNKSLAG
jgi:hypothetical protein